jgi:hypothetical protein
LLVLLSLLHLWVLVWLHHQVALRGTSACMGMTASQLPAITHLELQRGTAVCGL